MMLHGYGSHGGRFRTINQSLHTDRFVPGLIMLNVAILAWALCPHQAQAALSVAVLDARAETSYTVARSYGGEVRARRVSTLGFPHSGELEIVHVEEGDRVEAGDLLAELDPDPLGARVAQADARLVHAEATRAVAAAGLELAQETMGRFEDLVANGHTSVQRFDEVRLDLVAKNAQLQVAAAGVAQAEADLQLAKVDYDRSRIHAPYAGRIQTRFADEGAILIPGQQVLRLLESGAPEARIGLPQDVAAGLSTDGRFSFRSGGVAVTGRLLAVLPEVDARTRTVTALFALDSDALAVGSVIELDLERSVPQLGFWLPITALTEAQRGLWSVYVVVPEGEQSITERRLVEVIHTDRDRVFVQGTLRDGDRVVSTGTQRIVPGQIVIGIAAR